MSFIPFGKIAPIRSVLHASLHPFTRYIFIKVHIESCHCTVNCKFQLFSTPEPCTPKLRSLNFLNVVGNMGSPTQEIVADVRSIFSKSKTIAIEHVFPLLLSLKLYHVCVGVIPLFAHNFMTARCPNCSVGMRFFIST